jgi:hypothetical protein
MLSNGVSQDTYANLEGEKVFRITLCSPLIEMQSHVKMLWSLTMTFHSEISGGLRRRTISHRPCRSKAQRLAKLEGCVSSHR